MEHRIFLDILSVKMSMAEAYFYKISVGFCVEFIVEMKIIWHLPFALDFYRLWNDEAS